MRSEVFEIRYPNGDFEIAAQQTHGVPVAGDQLRRNDRVWRVTRVERRRPLLVHVELVESSPQRTGYRLPSGSADTSSRRSS